MTKGFGRTGRVGPFSASQSRQEFDSSTRNYYFGPAYNFSSAFTRVSHICQTRGSIFVTGVTGCRGTLKLPNGLRREVRVCVCLCVLPLEGCVVVVACAARMCVSRLARQPPENTAIS